MVIEKVATGQSAQFPFFLGSQSNGDLLPTATTGDP